MFNLVVDAGYVFFPSFFFFFILSFATILKFFVVHSRQVHLFFNNSELLAVRVKNLFLSFVKGERANLAFMARTHSHHIAHCGFLCNAARFRVITAHAFRFDFHASSTRSLISLCYEIFSRFNNSFIP